VLESKSMCNLREVQTEQDVTLQTTPSTALAPTVSPLAMPVASKLAYTPRHAPSCTLCGHCYRSRLFGVVSSVAMTFETIVTLCDGLNF
jgi:hypothetical protein